MQLLAQILEVFKLKYFLWSKMSSRIFSKKT